MTEPARQRGVTLVETLVALAIMGLVAGAVMTLIGQNTRFAATAQNRTYASILVDNEMVDTIGVISEIEAGVVETDVEFYSRIWRVRTTVAETAIENLFRIEIVVLDPTNGQSLARATTLRSVE